MFQTCIFSVNFNKVLIQCSHSKHANIIQTWSYNYNKTKLVCIDANMTSIKTFFKVQKMKNMSSMPLFMAKRHLSKIYMLLSNFKRSLFKPIFSSHHVMSSSIRSCCCNHLNIMLMSVKFIVVQLELIGIGFKLKFHSYSQFTSNKQYTLKYKFEKCKPNPKKLHGYEHILSTELFF
jgi:hypothetical protein